MQNSDGLKFLKKILSPLNVKLNRFTLFALLIIILAFVISLVFLIVLIAIRLKQTTGFDDAYMYVRYAKNFWAGYGIAWNRDGIQTYGVTSILYFVIITILQGLFLKLDGSTILITASAGLAIFGILLLAVTGTRFSKSESIHNSFFLTLAILTTALVSSKIFLYHLTSGMDTTLSFLCNCLLIFTVLNWVHGKDKYALSKVLAASYLSFLGRPDNLIYAVTFPILCVLLLDNTDRKGKVFRFLLGFGICLAMDALLKTALFGDPLPLPFYAKTNGFFDGYLSPQIWSPIIQLFDFGKLSLPYLLVIIFAFSTTSRKATRIVLAFFLPVLATFAYYFNVLQIMGHEARYYFPSLPFFIVSSVLVLDIFIEQRQDSKIKSARNSNVLRWGSSIGLAIFLLTPMIQDKFETLYAKFFIPTPHHYVSEAISETSSSQPLPTLGWWESIKVVAELSKHLPANTRFAMSEYGLAGAQAPQIYIIDLLGLNDPYFAHHGFSADVFFSRVPEIIWFPHRDYSKIIASIQDSPILWEDYDYYPGAFDYGMAIKKDGINHDAVYAEVEKAWKSAYGVLIMKDYLTQHAEFR